MMNVKEIPVLSVSYNSPELIDELIGSFRRFYDNQIFVVDGSDSDRYEAVESVCSRYKNVKFIHFDYNIHHGPGMAWAFQNLGLDDRLLVLDSDVVVLKAGFLETLVESLSPEMYGVGAINYVDGRGYDVEYFKGAIKYLHPACMLVNLGVVRQYPMPTKHGAPMFEAMRELHRQGKSDLLGQVEWLKEDFRSGETQHFIKHDWQGTVKNTAGYHLEDWQKSETDISSFYHAVTLQMPRHSAHIVEIGERDHCFAHYFKKINKSARISAVKNLNCGVKIDVDVYDLFVNTSMDRINRDLLCVLKNVDCWILDGAIERTADPKKLLLNIKSVMKPESTLIVVVPNFQHWSVLLSHFVGNFEYDESDIVNYRNQKMFTRSSFLKMAAECGFKIGGGSAIANARMESQSLLSVFGQVLSVVEGGAKMVTEDIQASKYIINLISS